MKKLLMTSMVLGSAVALSACSADGYSAADMDGSMLQPPYAEERTVGKTRAPAPVVRSAQPVFQSSQVK